MIQTSTYDDVIRYVYEETSEEENLAVEDTLMSDPEMMTQFLETLEIRALMNRIEREPRESSIQNILSYSRNYSSNPSV
ncbi:hypothetical protein [Arsenicibacter rosenii]|uniref:Anti-sigma factor n=1 Tax=Arsenicibacter rosenii TaxID=1750698 RepID=A0A1S2VQK3_9BACT|nr:hypothetical protein [Arsenicibacter rosenii]OIN60456.1 hypothetical protein BLX24_06455 [Arsenicibacter rosenii]